MRERISLRPYNTLGVEACARWFAEARDDRDVFAADQAASHLGLPVMALGGGSNLLLTRDVEALVLHVCSSGVRVLSDDGEQVLIEAEAGEVWHPFVMQTLQMGLAGLENLSLIPGTVGAAPVQNIGAYGVEFSNVCAGLTALDRNSGRLHDFTPGECEFAYRDSRFKHEPGRWLILRVRFSLQRTFHSRLEYGPLRQRLAMQGIERPTPLDVSQAICAIRSEKLPDPKVLGNAGSFFKNPVVSVAEAGRLSREHPGLMAYPQVDGRVKLAAGWLIERAGWKGFREGDAGVHQMQALVLVNHGQATGSQLLRLAKLIEADIVERFGIHLEMEPILV
nr:UDP-N-acetylmuramate dehydrogenase [Azomonas macrocytogenes]